MRGPQLLKSSWIWYGVFVTFLGISDETLQQPHETSIAMYPVPPNKDPEVNVEIQIMDLKDLYDKKTKKGAKGLEYRLENSEVTVVVRASAEITNVYAHVQRCARAAIRTHDTSGTYVNLLFA